MTDTCTNAMWSDLDTLVAGDSLVIFPEGRSLEQHVVQADIFRDRELLLLIVVDIPRQRSYNGLKSSRLYVERLMFLRA